METFYEDYYVLQYPHKNQVFVGIDSASGGYPYETTIKQAHKFTFEKVQEYLASFTKAGFIIKHVHVKFSLITVNN